MAASRLLALLATAACACGPGPDSGDGGIDTANPCAGGVPEDIPSSCPSPAPSYAKDVRPVLAQRCLPCHTPGAPLYALPDMTSYGAVYDARGVVLSQIATCKMPAVDAGAAPLTEAERQAIMGWLVCGAPDD